MSKILWANATESWKSACFYLDKILDSYITLQYRKMFVSMLHNSVELLIKQRMLDVNDHRVAQVKNPNSDGEPAKSYYAAQDLNEFFIKTAQNTMVKTLISQLNFKN